MAWFGRGGDDHEPSTGNGSGRERSSHYRCSKCHEVIDRHCSVCDVRYCGCLVDVHNHDDTEET